MELKWIKLSIGIFDNRKIRQIKHLPDGNALLVIWLQLLCLSGKINDGGRIYLTDGFPYTEEMLAYEFDETVATIQFALTTFENMNMLHRADGYLTIMNWEKYQAIDHEEKVRIQARERQRKYRENEKLIEIEDCHVTSHADVTLMSRSVTLQNKNKKENKKKSNNSIFTPPTLEEVKAYCTERTSPVDAKRFYDYYTEGEWKDAKGNPVKNWKLKLITWKGREDKGRIVYEKPEIEEMSADDLTTLTQRMKEDGDDVSKLH